MTQAGTLCAVSEWPRATVRQRTAESQVDTRRDLCVAVVNASRRHGAAVLRADCGLPNALSLWSSPSRPLVTPRAARAPGWAAVGVSWSLPFLDSGRPVCSESPLPSCAPA
jgi:hypothetical protein